MNVHYVHFKEHLAKYHERMAKSPVQIGRGSPLKISQEIPVEFPDPRFIKIGRTHLQWNQNNQSSSEECD